MSMEQLVEGINAEHQTDWHLLFAMPQEAALIPLLLEVSTETTANLKLVRIDMVILRRLTAQWTDEQLARLPDGIRQSLASHILCEFKYTQSINSMSLVQALMYDVLYLTSRKLKRQDVATFVISARTPQARVLKDFGYQESQLRGVYHSTQKLLEPITLIVLNRLSRETHNALFKCFASQPEEREASFALLEQIEAYKWAPEMGEILTGLKSVLQQYEGGKMNNVVISREFVKQLGQELEQTVIANMNPEKWLAKISLEQRLAGLKPEVVLSQYTPEVIEAYLKQHQQTHTSPKPRKKISRLKQKSKEDVQF